VPAIVLDTSIVLVTYLYLLTITVQRPSRWINCAD